MSSQIPSGPIRPPLPSRATRRISLRSRASGRAVLPLWLPAHPRPVKLVCESLLEARVALCLAARRDTWDLIEQPGSVRYGDARGRRRSHHLDLLCIRADGRRIAVVVKPWARAQTATFRDEFNRVRAATPLAFAARVVLVTDRDLHPDDVWNAARLQEARRVADPQSEARILGWLAGERDPQPLHRLAAATGLGPRAWPAVTRLLFDGRLRRIDGGRAEGHRADGGRIGATTVLGLAGAA